MNRPPALLYHKVTNDWEVGVTFIPPQQFEGQLQLIKSAGWGTMLPGDPVDSTAKQFLLSFDDGYESILTNALPICERIGFKGIVFIPSSWIGGWNDWDHQLLGRRSRHLDRSQLTELVKHGWMIGSHGVTHTDMTALSESECLAEMVNSRKLLQDITGQAIEWMAFPYGRYNGITVKTAIEAGYTGAVTPVLHPNLATGQFILWRADPVYLWDPIRFIPSRLEQSGAGYQAGKLFRRVTNLCTIGTLGWNKVILRKKISNP